MEEYSLKLLDCSAVKTQSHWVSFPPAEDVMEVEVVAGVETKAKASSPIVGKTFFTRKPYYEAFGRGFQSGTSCMHG